MDIWFNFNNQPRKYLEVPKEKNRLYFKMQSYTLADHTKRDPRPFSTRTYKDASKTNTGVGIAITNSNNLFLSYRLLDYNSIYTAKYLALLGGIRVAIQLPNPIINICTDSLSALNVRMYTFHSSTRAIKIGM